MTRLFFLILFVNIKLLAQVKVAFFEYRQQNGQFVSIEPGGRLYHVAIQYQNKWMQAHPFFGVKIDEKLEHVGQLYSVIEINNLASEEYFKKQLRKKFSITDSWQNKNSTYCSKLVAEILNIQPTLMKNGQGWGLSPDDLYKILKQQPHVEVLSCRQLF